MKEGKSGIDRQDALSPFVRTCLVCDWMERFSWQKHSRREESLHRLPWSIVWEVFTRKTCHHFECFSVTWKIVPSHQTSFTQCPLLYSIQKEIGKKSQGSLLTRRCLWHIRYSVFFDHFHLSYIRTPSRVSCCLGLSSFHSIHRIPCQSHRQSFSPFLCLSFFRLFFVFTHSTTLFSEKGWQQDTLSPEFALPFVLLCVVMILMDSSFGLMKTRALLSCASLVMRQSSRLFPLCSWQERRKIVRNFWCWTHEP